MRLPADLYQAIKRHALDTAPRECVGLVGGFGGDLCAVFPLENIADDPTDQYQVALGDQQVALQTIANAGLKLCAVYHSHPRAAAVPSLRDIREAFPGIHIIIGMGKGLVTRAFSITGDPIRKVVEVPLEVG